MGKAQVVGLRYQTLGCYPGRALSKLACQLPQVAEGAIQDLGRGIELD